MNAIANPMAELVAMRARGEIDTEEFKLAKKYLLAEMGETDKPTAKAESDEPVRAIWLNALLLAFWLTPYAVVLLIVIGVVSAAVSWVIFGAPEGPQTARHQAVSQVRTEPMRRVDASQYGEDWPYPPYEHGNIRCRLVSHGAVKRPVITIELGSAIYGLNGPALSSGEYRDPRHLIPKDAYGIFRGKTPTVVGEFITIGTRLCT